MFHPRRAEAEMRFHLTDGIVHRAVSRSFEPEVAALPDGVIVRLVQASQRLIADGPGLFRVGRAVDEGAEILMVGAVAVVINDVGGVFDEEGDAGRIGELGGLLQRQVAVAQDDLLLRQADQIEQHEIQLFAGVVQQPLPVFRHGAPEEGVRIREDLVHCRLTDRIGQPLMPGEVLVRIVHQEAMTLRQRPGDGRLAAAGRTGDEVDILQRFFEDIILKYHCKNFLIK